MAKVLNPKSLNEVMEKVEEPLIVQQKRFLVDLMEPSTEKRDYTEQPAAYLEDEPEEFKKRIAFLCLRGLRDGLLQYIEMFKISDISRVNNFFYFAKTYDPNKRKMRKVKEKFGDIESEQYEMLNTVEENIKRRLIKDPIVNKHLSLGNEGILESNCKYLARYIAEEYSK